MSKKLVIYVAGRGISCEGYSNWIHPTGFTNKIEEADLVLGLGGSDVGSHYYNQPDSGLLLTNKYTDSLEYEDYKKAISLKKKIVGICKGSQWGAALAGGAIFQHIEHPRVHNITTYDGKVLLTNSLHHNMQDVSALKEGNDYKLLAWAENLSPVHINGYGKNIKCSKEAEVVYYPKINFLAFQNHNEMIYGRKQFDPVINWSKDILNKFLNNSL